MTYFEAYLFTRLDSINILFALCFGLGLVFSLMIMPIKLEGIYGDSELEAWKFIKKFWKVSIPVLIFGITGSVLTPSTKQAAFIYIAPAIVNNQDIQKTIKKLPELSGLGLEYLGEILKEEIKETKKEVKESIK